MLYFNFSGILRWTQTLPKGDVSTTSIYCTTYQRFLSDIRGKLTTSIEIGAGRSYFLCNDSTKAKDIMDAFSACSRKCTTKSFLCNERTWYLGNWGSGAEISIDSANTVYQGAGSCDGAIAIRPCIGHKNWGGEGPKTCGQESQTLQVVAKYTVSMYIFFNLFSLITEDYITPHIEATLFQTKESTFNS